MRELSCLCLPFYSFILIQIQKSKEIKDYTKSIACKITRAQDVTDIHLVELYEFELLLLTFSKLFFSLLSKSRTIHLPTGLSYLIIFIKIYKDYSKKKNRNSAEKRMRERHGSRDIGVT